MIVIGRMYEPDYFVFFIDQYAVAGFQFQGDVAVTGETGMMDLPGADYDFYPAIAIDHERPVGQAVRANRHQHQGVKRGRKYRSPAGQGIGR